MISLKQIDIDDLSDILEKDEHTKNEGREPK
jgi:hypothetical protein